MAYFYVPEYEYQWRLKETKRILDKYHVFYNIEYCAVGVIKRIDIPPHQKFTSACRKKIKLFGEEIDRRNETLKDLHKVMEGEVYYE